mmetsp:Transcript_41476/g.111999  ORF Transcript_41476/g.111999 Transcript_41476/m.111999 type:complete len:231 (-) Transcript_41476:761-1453(-)
MSMMVQNAASMVPADRKCLCSSSQTKGRPDSAAAAQKAYFNKRLCSLALPILTEKSSTARCSRKNEFQEGFRSARRPSDSSAISAMSASASFPSSRVWTLSKPSMAWSSSSRFPGSTCGARPMMVLQMAATHLLRQFTTGSGTIILLRSPKSARNTGGSSSSSSRVFAWQASSWMTSNAPRITPSEFGALSMACMTTLMPARCPSAQTADSSQPCWPSMQHCASTSTTPH